MSGCKDAAALASKELNRQATGPNKMAPESISLSFLSFFLSSRFSCFSFFSGFSLSFLNPCSSSMLLKFWNRFTRFLQSGRSRPTRRPMEKFKGLHGKGIFCFFLSCLSFFSFHLFFLFFLFFHLLILHICQGGLLVFDAHNTGSVHIKAKVINKQLIVKL